MINLANHAQWVKQTLFQTSLVILKQDTTKEFILKKKKSFCA